MSTGSDDLYGRCTSPLKAYEDTIAPVESTDATVTHIKDPTVRPITRIPINQKCLTPSWNGLPRSVAKSNFQAIVLNPHFERSQPIAAVSSYITRVRKR